jgi:hypothetical protein
MKNKPYGHPDLALHIALENLKGFARKSNETDLVAGKTTDTPTRPTRRFCVHSRPQPTTSAPSTSN